MPATDRPATDELSERQTEIVQIVGERGYETLETLARHFGVSVQSVRRDVIQLDRLRLLQRFHGGAGLTEATVRLGYVEKRMRAMSAKARIGEVAASMVSDGATIFLDVGTTIEALARCLRGRPMHLRAFTNSLATGMILAGDPNIDLHVFGGSSRGADGSLVGAATLAGIEAIRFDLAFVGFSGIDGDGTVMDYDLEKIAVKQAAMRRADASVIVGDHSKFGRRAVAVIAVPGQFSRLVTDAPPPETLRNVFERARLEIHQAPYPITADPNRHRASLGGGAK